MREDHRIYQPDSSCEPTSGQSRDSGQKVGEQEDCADHRRVELESNVEPVGNDALDDEAATERIEGE